jgi:hypothetical protein
LGSIGLVKCILNPALTELLRSTSPAIAVKTMASIKPLFSGGRFLTDKGLSEAAAIEAVLSDYFDNPPNELMKRLARMEQSLSDVKGHLLAIRYGNS